MNLTIAILTGDHGYGQGLCAQPLSHFNATLGIVDNTSDFAFRPLARSDLVILGRDMTRRQILKVLRAMRILRAPSHVILVVRSQESVDQAFEFLSRGVRAVVLDEGRETDLKTAVEQVLLDRQYMSPKLIMPMLKRYREMCAELRERSAEIIVDTVSPPR